MRDNETSREHAQSEADLIGNSWRINAQRWSRVVREGRIASRTAVTDRAIMEAVLGCAPTSVLDLGCGEGWLCRALSTRVQRCVGIDASPELIAAATAAGGGDFFNVSYEQLVAQPAAVGCGFDMAVANFSLLEDPDLALVLMERGDDWQLLWDLSGLAYDVFLETGILIQPVPISSSDWAHPESFPRPSFLRNVAREGIAL